MNAVQSLALRVRNLPQSKTWKDLLRRISISCRNLSTNGVRHDQAALRRTD